MDVSIPLTLHVRADAPPDPDELQDALERAWPWSALARQLGAAAVTLRVDALADDTPTTTTTTKEPSP